MSFLCQLHLRTFIFICQASIALTELSVFIPAMALFVQHICILWAHMCMSKDKTVSFLEKLEFQANYSNAVPGRTSARRSWIPIKTMKSNCANRQSNLFLPTAKLKQLKALGTLLFSHKKDP